MLRRVSSAFALILVSSFVMACPATGTDRPDAGGGVADAGGCTGDMDCPAGQICKAGACEPRPACQRNTDCPEGQECNLITGACQPGSGSPDGGSTDGGGVPEVCTAGTVQCGADGLSVETCAEDGSAWENVVCADPTPACLGGVCVLCAPGAAECAEEIAQTCRADGSGWDPGENCADAGGQCVNGACLVCTPDDRECKDEVTARHCTSTGSAWVEEACGDGACDPTSRTCVAKSCTPGVSPDLCQDDVVVRCNAVGSAYEALEDCAAAGDVCREGACVDLCEEAAAGNSYIGCEYWPVILANDELSVKFQAEFAVVVSNPHAGTTAEVKVYDATGAALRTVQVAGGTLETIKLPWNAMKSTKEQPDGNVTPMTRRGATAYRLVSTVPVTAYQFNPLSSNLPSGCTEDAQCPLQLYGDKCNPGTAPRSCSLSDYSYTNDASLLLPVHIFGKAGASPVSSYVVMALPHSQLESDPWIGSTVKYDSPTLVAIVATAPGTTNVTVQAKGAVAAGDGIGVLPASGGLLTVALQQYEVLQLASAPGVTAQSVSQSDLGRTLTMREWRDSDLTGSVVSADQPVAVYSGASCRFVPFDKWACDHVEQQLFPFRTWGHRYIGARTQPPPGGNATVGDIWRIVAAADGTQLTFNPAIAGVTTSLNAGQWVEFQTTRDFLVSSQDADHPISLAQWMVGQTATGSNMGDPTMILASPIDQYRDTYAFITPLTIAKDYANVVRTVGTALALDGQPPSTATGCAAVGTSGFEVCRIAIGDGPHRLVADTPVGLTVYGYDLFVSYGYPGGLDLRSIVVINPGG